MQKINERKINQIGSMIFKLYSLFAFCKNIWYDKGGSYNEENAVFDLEGNLIEGRISIKQKKS